MENRLLQSLDSSHTPVAVLDRELTLVCSNLAFQQVFEGRCLMLRVPEVRTRLERLLALDAAEEDAFDVDIPLPERGVRTLECRVSRISVDPRLLLLTIADVTERRRNALWLRGHEQVLDRLAANAPLEEILESLAKILEELHPGMLCSVLLLDESRTRLIHGAGPSLPADYVEAIDGIRIGPSVGSCGTAAFRNQRVITVDIRTDGRWRNYRRLARAHGLRACWSEPVTGPSGEVLGTLAMYYRTPRAPSAEELQSIEAASGLAAEAIRCARARQSLAAEAQRANYALEESEARYRTVVGQLPVIVYRLEVRGGAHHFSSVSPECEQLLGYTAEEWLGDPELFSRLVHPDDRARILPLERRLETGDQLDVQYRIVARDGSVRWFRDLARPLPHDEGLCGVLLDMTEQRRLESELIQAQRLEAVGNMSAGLAHEYNNLLMGIAGCTKISLGELQRGNEAVACSMLEDVLEAAERGAALAKDLLAFSSKQDATTPSNIDKVVTAAKRMLGSLLPDDIELSVRCRAPSAMVGLSEGQVMQVLTNLVLNSRDAMPRGGLIEVLTREIPSDSPGSGRVVLTVRDTGTGIPLEDQRLIFEPFFSTKRRSGGTGLGMTVVYGLLKRHDAKIEIESEPGAGTTVRVTIPSLRLSPQVSTRDEVVLVVDDEPRVLLTLRHYLEVAGFQVLAAPDPEAALDVAAAQVTAPVLLVVDVSLPRMDGTELVARLHERWPNVPVIYASAYSREYLLETRRIDPGATLLEKPFSRETLLLAVDEHLQLARSQG